MRANRDAAEFKTGYLPLKPPRVAVHVENPLAQKIAQDRREGPALWVVLEIGSEHVLDVFRVGRDGVVEDVDVDCPGGGAAEEVSVPVGEVFEVRRPAPGEVALANVAFARWLEQWFC
ncbi:hypothetical protein RHMOL_Rhmol01G0281600 [Rhododendron molle]|uniref:Uncharacterized protein n=1 Tax=Rhododendron molle TaxID=49168 RepID=A0ACC0Q889_RHOML|nr:hypothetical protein RHMOL_Rhmol01G0281600 [Rhododendron molle]